MPFRITLNTGPNHVRNIALEEFVNRLTERTEGELDVQVFSSGQLYKGPDVPKALAQGAVGVGVLSLADKIRALLTMANIVNSVTSDDNPPQEEAPSYEETRPKLPAGSKPIDKTPWSGDHQEIKEGVGSGPADKTSIDKKENVWVENPDGTWTKKGYAGDYTSSGKPSGRRGKDRKKNRR